MASISSHSDHASISSHEDDNNDSDTSLDSPQEQTSGLSEFMSKSSLSAMTPLPTLTMGLLELPYELQVEIVDWALITCVVPLMQTNRHIHNIAIRQLYTHIRTSSLRQLYKLQLDDPYDDEPADLNNVPFDDGPYVRFGGNLTRREHQHCKVFSKSLVINIPSISPLSGAPTSTFRPFDETPIGGVNRQHQVPERLGLVGEVLKLCPLTQSLSVSLQTSCGYCNFFLLTSCTPQLEFFSFKRAPCKDDATFTRGIQALTKLKHLRWVTPSPPSAISGFSISIVDDALRPLQNGLALSALHCLPTSSHPLRSVELHAVNFPTERVHGKDYSLLWILSQQRDLLEETDSGEIARQALFPHLRRVHIRSAVNLQSGGAIARLALLRAYEQYTEPSRNSPPLSIHIADGFCGSIWGDRLGTEHLRECMRRLFDDPTLSKDADVKLDEWGRSPSFAGLDEPERLELMDRAMLMISLEQLEGAIGGAS